MKIALTGGATGIGAAIAAKMKSLGHHVTAFDIHQPQSHVDVWIQTDLSDKQSIEAAVAKAQGPFDALINNAGLPPREGLEEPILKVNYFGLVALLDAMMGKLTKGAAIVNTASRAGAAWRDNIDEVKALMALDPDDLPDFISEREIDPTRAYTLSKEAVIVMTMARAAEMISKDLRMNSASPAAITTDILKDFSAAFGKQMELNVARVGRPGNAEEAANVIVFLASPESAWIKGQDIVIDGGMSAVIASEAMGLVAGKI